MAIPSNVNVTLTYGAESTFGTQSAAAGQLLRRVNSTLALGKDTINSNEVRPDQQVFDVRHGTRRVSGNITGELSKTTYDDFIAAVVRGTWSSNELIPGVLTPSFTIEQRYPDSDMSKVFLGCRIGEMSVNLDPAGMVQVSFGIQGQDMTVAEGAGSPVFASPAAATTTGLMAGVSGSLTVDGVASTVVTGISFSINNGLNTRPVVGATKVPDIWYGRTVVNGQVQAFFEDTTLLNAFLNETEVAIVSTLTATDSTSMTFKFKRVKFMGHADTIGADGGVIASIPFQSLLAAAGGGDGAGSIIIERA